MGIMTNVQAAPPDPILGLAEAYCHDPNPLKINLGVGVYQDDDGQTPILHAVHAAEERLLAERLPKTYLPIAGSPGYAAQVQRLIFGDGHEVAASGRARTVQAPGGTAALRVGADLMAALVPGPRVWVSRPTWPNHPGIFKAGGFRVEEYPYYDPVKRAVDFPGMKACLARIPAGDAVVLHVSCHNPTGADLSVEEWREVADLARRGGWVPFLDFAYQGFGSGVETDRAGLLAIAEAVPEFLVANSFAKNFGLYAERAGALTLVAATSREADAAFSQAKRVVRTMYSNPPAHGALIVKTVLEDAALNRQWRGELDAMRARLVWARGALIQGLTARGVRADCEFVKRQHGLFSMIELTPDQIRRLRDEHSIYVVDGGRVNVAGITSRNVSCLCDALARIAA